MALFTRFEGFGGVMKTLASAETKWLEITSAAFMIVWSLLMVSPINVLQTSQSYRFLDFLGEGFIGSFGAFIAAMSIFGIVNGKRGVRRFALIMAQFFWGTIGACFFLANYESSGGYIYASLAFLCAIGYAYGEQATEQPHEVR